MQPTQPKTLEEYKALVESVYATCEGAGGHYKDALHSIFEQIAEFYWPPDDAAAWTMKARIAAMPVPFEVEPCPSCGSTNPNECQHDCTNTVRIEVSKKGAT